MQDLADAIVSSMRDPILVLAPDLRVLFANPAYRATFGDDDPTGRPLADLGDGQWSEPALRQALEALRDDGEEVLDLRVELDIAAIGRRTMLLNGRRLDRMPRILLAIRDISDRRQHEADQLVLLGELQHRVKNILANVQATATATLRRSSSLEEFEAAFLQRLGAMARTQDVLMRAPSGRAGIRDLVLTEMQAHGRDSDPRLSRAGPDLTLSPRIAQVLATVLHELMTNAMRHGALSQPGGRLALRWSVEREDGRDHLRFVWQETGMALAGPPSQKGFGSRLIERSVDYSLGGASRLDHTPGGVVWAASIPLAEARDRP